MANHSASCGNIHGAVGGFRSALDRPRDRSSSHEDSHDGRRRRIVLRSCAQPGYIPLDNDWDKQVAFVKATWQAPRPQLLVAYNHDVTTLAGVQPNEAGLFRHVDGPAASARWDVNLYSGSPRLVQRTGSRRGR